ncbi:hypothetical protein Ahy_A06g027780 [Arachis hypogaea]|uniref:Uncharacterized protein n=1 Tax=Arachis hypogaea TaxID=3818 RepID=A0A445CPQ3_ARAHY|nr:hypothetical protein Ahy_A06g027780 [Arachis hypogaea]
MAPESSHDSEPVADAPPSPPILHFRWDVEHDVTIRKIFDNRMGRRLQQMLDDVRQGRDHRRQWLRPDIKKALFVYWEIDEGFRHRHLTNRANRASVKSSKYTGSSMTFMKMKARLECKSLDREAILGKTFKYTHMLKEKKETFDDQRSQDHYRSRLSSLSKVGRTPPIGDAVVDPDAVWHETASAPYKNRVYRMGSIFASSIRTSMLRLSLGSTSRRAEE